MKAFPYEFDSHKEILFHPRKPDDFGADVLEVGPGRGDLVLAMARENPAQRFVAIEMGKKRYFRLGPRLEKNGLSNVLLIRGDARLVLPQYFKEGTFEKILVLFPDPWPKKRHAFRRLLSVEFLWLLTHQLKPGGLLILATDVASYAEWVLGNLAQIPALANDLGGLPHLPSLPELPKTYFEEKWRKEGRELYFMRFRKTG